VPNASIFSTDSEEQVKQRFVADLLMFSGFSRAGGDGKLPRQALFVRLHIESWDCGKPDRLCATHTAYNWAWFWQKAVVCLPPILGKTKKF